MEADLGGKLKLNYTSCRCMLMEVDWGGKLIVNSMISWEPMIQVTLLTLFTMILMQKQ